MEKTTDNAHAPPSIEMRVGGVDPWNANSEGKETMTGETATISG